MITQETIFNLADAIDAKNEKYKKHSLYIKAAVIERITRELTYSINILSDYDCFKQFEKDRDKAETVLVDNQDFEAVAQELINQIDTIETTDLYAIISDLGEVFDILNDAIDVVYGKSRSTDCVIRNNVLYLTERNVIQMMQSFMHDNEKSELWQKTLKFVREINTCDKERINFIVDCAFTTYDDNGFMIGGKPFIINNHDLNENRDSFDKLSSDLLGGSADFEDDLAAMHDPIFDKGINIDMSMFSVALGFKELSEQAYQVLDNLIFHEN